MANAEQVAKAIVGQWGYEEAGWWEPIMLALLMAYSNGFMDGSTGGSPNVSNIATLELLNLGENPQ